MIKRVKRSNPYDGEWLLIGHLAQEGINVPTARVRASIHRVDPINTELRTSITVIRMYTMLQVQMQYGTWMTP